VTLNLSGRDPPIVSRSYVSLMEQAASDHGRIFAEGYLAGISGDLRSANPQKAESIEAAAWLEGWDQGNAKREQNNARSRKRIHPLDTS
jgi:ribosome modulation factor